MGGGTGSGETLQERTDAALLQRIAVLKKWLKEAEQELDRRRHDPDYRA